MVEARILYVGWLYSKQEVRARYRSDGTLLKRHGRPKEEAAEGRRGLEEKERRRIVRLRVDKDLTV